MSWYRNYDKYYARFHYPHYNYHFYRPRYFPGSRMFGRLFFFLVGMYAGVLANQKYRIPDAPYPSEAWEKMKEHCERDRRERWGRWEKDQAERRSFFENPEVKEIIDKLKNLEKKYRKSSPSSPSNPSNPSEEQ